MNGTYTIKEVREALTPEQKLVCERAFQHYSANKREWWLKGEVVAAHAALGIHVER